jgi:hypothetical protein
MSRSLTPVFVVIVAAICVAVGSSIAWSSLAGPTNPTAYATKADFDQAFADAAVGHRDFKPADVEKLRQTALRSSAAR